jgi:putative peptide maturation dehydrogenase
MPMLLRRCAALALEPHERAVFELQSLLQGGTGVLMRREWLAHAPHLAAAVVVEPEDIALLGAVGPDDWVDADALRAAHGGDAVERLLDAGLLVADQGPHRPADDRVRAQHWHGLSAVAHAASRWQGEDAIEGMRAHGVGDAAGLLERYGTPPPAVREAGAGAACVALPRAGASEFDTLLDARTTCRNFEPGVPLSLEAFAAVLERTFGARAQASAGPGFDVLKKTSPSGGALHPTEAWLLVQHVEGIASGLYHYRPTEHTLHAMPWPGDAAALRSLARTAVAGQDYFAEAHVLVVLASRFARNFWKYRNHAKAYRVCILDAGHLSQTLLLSATEQGLGAFVTAAINEADIEDAFGLDGCVDGPLAVCGFGIRAADMATSEFDPAHKVWR